MKDVAGFDPVALEVWRGFVFLHLGSDSPPLAEALPDLVERFDAWPVEELVGVHRTEYELAANWKVWDLANRQDWELCANAHRGVVSRAWTPGPYSELEGQLAAFDRHYLEALGRNAACG